MDMGSTTTDYEHTSFGLTYTVSDELSVTYGTETHESYSCKHVDAEYRWYFICLHSRWNDTFRWYQTR